MKHDLGDHEIDQLLDLVIDLHNALLGIVNASNANPEPIHFAVRGAIDAGRAALTRYQDSMRVVNHG